MQVYKRHSVLLYELMMPFSLNFLLRIGIFPKLNYFHQHQIYYQTKLSADSKLVHVCHSWWKSVRQKKTMHKGKTLNMWPNHFVQMGISSDLNQYTKSHRRCCSLKVQKRKYFIRMNMHVCTYLGTICIYSRFSNNFPTYTFQI